MLKVRVTPRARKTEIAGLWTGPDAELRLSVRVTAAPEDGKANAAVLNLVASLLSLPKSRMAVVAGKKDRLKTVRIEGETHEIERRLLALLAACSGGKGGC